MAEPRLSFSPSRFSEGAFNNFRKKVNRAVDETNVIVKVFPILEGNSDVLSNMKRTFANLVPLTNGTIVNAQSDFYYGVRPDQLDPYVQKELKSYIIPSINDRAPMLTNNFIEGKGFIGTRAMTKR